MPERPYGEAVSRHPPGMVIPVALGDESDEELLLRLRVRPDGEELAARLALKDMLAFGVQRNDVLSLPRQEVGVEEVALTR